ncbi:MULTISPECIES: Na+/H+ antiporter subunit E [unclassified Shinella]|uniref:Na+/H+ antiporter subunit E n=1 Tax=unclassified Shinella TaxID=2643062 RepID=UPI00225CF92D|nr:MULTISPECIES: Na+/H+ antiporter subunit E [unclassified Shinella]CAI0335765.1 putative K(+)/H(+) antiporter subunit E [Rhizobiaceae bacterium]CAK7260069.1 putative K(+)/H(+) antiporter subunit E [Shinella sp. WSC3-e]MCO5138105.1 Na+/H+ antiporter subunit E [Shinella sp.]MCW5708145.1 Na+/H+ antiporter subunit E [Shinella sp.]MDC7258222.1 Na+/H+ antiporter subunit E [Shinella sp. YE25]
MLPYPLLSASLVIMWLALNGFTPGHLILGCIVSVFASWGMAALRPVKPRLPKWYLLPKLVGIVLYDILRSNLAVASILLTGGRRKHKSGFITVPIELENPTALAVLAVVITSTPGTAWLEYNSLSKTVLIHVLDLVDEAEWQALIKTRYEALLMEIFK